MADAISVTQLNSRVKSILSDSTIVNDIWVMGEISNLKLYSSGHYYFTLKDSGSEIRCVMFKSSRSRVDFEPSDNMKVMMFGHVDMYVERGSYQFIAETMKKSGIGDLYLAYEELKNRLESEGLFEKSRKKSLPKYPQSIGVVTSLTGAVIHDIITTSRRLFPADIILAPAQVQGDGAAESIVAGIELLNKEGVDVMIVGRGGGSIEDLWAFNEEIVARAIASSKVPIISAVGHENDNTIADYVADVRAPTPTAAAELALRDKREVIIQLDTDIIRLNKSLSNTIERMHNRFKISDSKLSPRRAEEKVSLYSMRLDELSIRLRSSLKDSIENMRGKFLILDSRLDPLIINIFNNHKKDITSMSQRLEGLNPYNVLGRGYSFITDKSGKALISAFSVKNGDVITVRMKDGKLDTEVNNVELNK